MKKGKVLSVDDDQNLQLVVSDYLTADGYQVTQAYDVANALVHVEEETFDIILLDLVLPDGEGLSLIPQFQQKSKTPIVVVSGKSETTEKVVCLEMGADDYITKPFEMRELSARIKAIMRRSDSTPAQQEPAPTTEKMEQKAEVIKFCDGWTLDRAQYQLFKPDESSAELTTGEFQLLDALISSPQKTLSRERLFELTRDGEYDIYDRAIDIQVARIRKKLKDDNGELIKTVRGVGYMFCGNVSA